MKKRSGFQVMLRLVGLVRPLAGFMVLAILLGLVGHLCAAFLTVLGGYALAGALGLEIPFSGAAVWRGAGVCGGPGVPALWGAGLQPLHRL